MAPDDGRVRPEANKEREAQNVHLLGRSPPVVVFRFSTRRRSPPGAHYSSHYLLFPEQVLRPKKTRACWRFGSQAPERADPLYSSASCDRSSSPSRTSSGKLARGCATHCATGGHWLDRVGFCKPRAVHHRAHRFAIHGRFLRGHHSPADSYPSASHRANRGCINCSGDV